MNQIRPQEWSYIVGENQQNDIHRKIAQGWGFNEVAQCLPGKYEVWIWFLAPPQKTNKKP